MLYSLCDLFSLGEALDNLLTSLGSFVPLIWFASTVSFVPLEEGLWLRLSVLRFGADGHLLSWAWLNLALARRLLSKDKLSMSSREN